MRLLITLLILSLSAPSQSKDMDGEFATFGVGGNRCKTYIKVRKSKVRKDMLVYTDWLQGYLSAFNLIADNTYDIMGGRSLGKAILWLDKYCSKQPDEIFINAAAALTLRLFPTRKNFAPNKNTEKKWLESGNVVSESEAQAEQPVKNQ